MSDIHERLRFEKCKRWIVSPRWRRRLAERKLNWLLQDGIREMLERSAARLPRPNAPSFVYIDECRDWSEVEAQIMRAAHLGHPECVLTLRHPEGVNIAEKLMTMYQGTLPDAVR